MEAIRQGMADYVLKDDLARLPHVIERALEVHNARKAQARAAAGWPPHAKVWPS